MCSLIYFALPILLFIAPFTHVSPRPPRRRRGRFIVPVPPNTPKMALRIPIVDIAIHHTAPTKFHKMALHIRIVGIAIHIISPYQNHLVRIVKRAR